MKLSCPIHLYQEGQRYHEGTSLFLVSFRHFVVSSGAKTQPEHVARIADAPIELRQLVLALDGLLVDALW